MLSFWLFELLLLKLFILLLILILLFPLFILLVAAILLPNLFVLLEERLLKSNCTWFGVLEKTKGLFTFFWGK